MEVLWGLASLLLGINDVRCERGDLEGSIWLNWHGSLWTGSRKRVRHIMIQRLR